MSPLPALAAARLRLALLALVPCACRLGPPDSAAAAASPPPGEERVERRLSLMGTWFTLDVRADTRERCLAASESAVRAVQEAEARLSTWTEGSELARLNRAPVGEPFELSPELAADLGRVAHLWRATGGAFDPGLGALVQAWGLRTGGRRPQARELERARSAGGFGAFELSGRTAVRRHPEARLEEGGFGKGIALDAALRALRAAGASSARLDLGGQLALLGPQQVRYGLADPRARARALLELVLDGGSLSTTGNSERGIVVDGEPRAHVLDPWRGEPLADFGSLTVWTADATAADCLSTGLYVLGPERALDWAAAHPGVEVIVLEITGASVRVRASPGWSGRLEPLVPGLEPEFSVPEPH